MSIAILKIQIPATIHLRVSHFRKQLGSKPNTLCWVCLSQWGWFRTSIHFLCSRAPHYGQADFLFGVWAPISAVLGVYCLPHIEHDETIRQKHPSRKLFWKKRVCWAKCWPKQARPWAETSEHPAVLVDGRPVNPRFYTLCSGKKNEAALKGFLLATDKVGGTLWRGAVV